MPARSERGDVESALAQAEVRIDASYRCAANHHNPIPIVVPCHRVIASSGGLCGYGGGLAMKEKLLRLEGAIA